MDFKHIISSKKIRIDAENYYENGFYCSEAVIASIRDNFELSIPEEVICMGSGFPVGIGLAKCLCGSVAGGVMVLGLFFGRSKPIAPKTDVCFRTSKELHDFFKMKNGAICCRVLTKGMDFSLGDHKAQCTRFTGEVAEVVSQIIVRELGLTDLDATIL